MIIKANLHFHSKEDPVDHIKYTLYEGIKKAHELGFDVLASTCHTKHVCTQDHIEYAKNKGILLIPGIEANIYENNSNKKNHVVILNCDASADDIKTFDDLKEYRKKNPEIFIIAPHPYFYGNFSLGDNLIKYIEIFDAIEISWFYTKWFNRNKKAEKIAKKYNKLIIATSDTHFFNFIDTNFITLNTDKLTVESFFNSINAQKYTNTTSPRSLFDIFIIFIYHESIMKLSKRINTITKLIKQAFSTNKTSILAPAYIKISQSKNQTR